MMNEGLSAGDILALTRDQDGMGNAWNNPFIYLVWLAGTEAFLVVGIQGALAENRFAQQNCCCEIKGGIKDLSAEGYRNTCEITTAIHAEGEATRALINSNTMQELRDKLAEKDREVQARDFQLSQIAQTSNIVGQIKPCPVPALV